MDRPSRFLISRRHFLNTAAATLGARHLAAQGGEAVHSLTALLDGSAMVRVPAGEFQMGSPSGEADEMPVHRVRITRDFEIGKFEVTAAQWETVMLDPHAGPAAVRKTPAGATVGPSPSRFTGPSLPVENVSWDDIQVFLDRLNGRDREHLYRLPTEAEWEFACRTNPGDTAREIWSKENSGDRTHPVGSLAPGARGTFDMLGNVAEWVSDWYAHDYYAESPVDDPPGPRTGSYRVFRGGSWLDPARRCRVTARNFEFPVTRLDNVGFRVVRIRR